ncbi:transcription repressor OFP8-like [Oryza sativa Japonica Group]|jgi:uncharacterized protein (TIGR01568 family)|uniref:Transcription repressor n=2 Tax=Oryza TaxID=4527 RepID=B9FIQ9_ORYSJ|nr:hypothetical protein OsJ_19697 [Oryza sativa Japonica Group]KAF2932319.1 hypothetical protein DAI22_05g278600 [Oryza sativa Japonica Group]
MDMSKARRHGVGVGVRLRQRLSQILLHSSCTTTSATAFVTNVAVAAGNAAAARQAPPPAAANDAHQPRPKIDGSVRRRRRRSARALVHISIDCSGPTSARSVGAAVMPSPVAPAKDVKAVIRSKARGGRPRSPSYSCSSSTVTDDELPPFSSSDGEGGEGAETRSSTLFSSLSISSDSTSDFYNSTGGGSKRHHKNPPRRVPRRAPPRGANAGDAKPHEDNKGGAKKADDKHGGGVVGVAAAGSMAVVKRSHNPYADFRSSMVEMVVERRICGADAMGDLLMSYLSLNSRRHHPAILAAFEDVWEAVFATP